MIADLTNGAFELFGSVAVWTNIRKLWQDKEIKGIHWQLSFFFTSWSTWNLYYYFSLHQYFSWACSMSLALANLVWLGQAIYYSYPRYDYLDLSPPTEERLQWLKECAEESREAEKRFCCMIATYETGGLFYCTRREGHDGPCAAKAGDIT